MGRIAFEFMHTMGNITALRNKMKMVFEHNIGIYIEIIALHQVSKIVQHYLYTLPSCKDRYPVLYCTGHEMRRCRFVNFISASSHLGSLCCLLHFRCNYCILKCVLWLRRQILVFSLAHSLPSMTMGVYVCQVTCMGQLCFEWKIGIPIGTMGTRRTKKSDMDH